MLDLNKKAAELLAGKCHGASTEFHYSICFLDPLFFIFYVPHSEKCVIVSEGLYFILIQPVQ